MHRERSDCWRVAPVAWVPIALAIGAEATSNALRAYGLGMHLDRFTITVQGRHVSVAGAVLVAGAVAVSISQARAAWVALTPGDSRQRWVAGIAAVLLITISVTAMASHILEATRAKVADEGGARGRYDRAAAAHDKAAAELAGLSGVRSVGDVQASIDAAPVPRSALTRTAQCTDVTREDSFRDCKPILDLRQELAKATRKSELEPEVALLRSELVKLQRPEDVSTPEGVLAAGWAWMMGLGVVFVATFGPVIFARVDSPSSNATAPPIAEPITPVCGAGRRGRRGATRKDERVVAFVDDYRRRKGRDPAIADVIAAFPDMPPSTAQRYRKCNGGNLGVMALSRIA